jgi:hypothetical protein
MSASTQILSPLSSQHSLTPPSLQRAQERLRLALHKLDDALRAQSRARSDFLTAMRQIKSQTGAKSPAANAQLEALGGVARKIDASLATGRAFQEEIQKMVPQG